MDADALYRSELLDVISRGIAAHPRTQQTRIGPSEIGTPCVRRLGHKLAGTNAVNVGGDGWKATIGTAVHAWLAEVFASANANTPEQLSEALQMLYCDDVPGPMLATPMRWLVEQRVTAGTIDGATLDGSCDLFDTATGTVVDWKCISLANLKRYRSNGPGEQYRIQAHTYGLGWTERGLDVHTVAIVFLPRDADLRHTYLWSEAFDIATAQESIDRASGIAAAIRQLGAPAILPLLPTADAYCRWCPFYRTGSTDLLTSCPGHGAAATRPDPLAGLTGRNNA